MVFAVSAIAVSTSMSPTMVTSIGEFFTIGAQAYLDTGQLVDLFPDWPDETFPLYAFYPSRRQPPAKVRAFVDFALRAVR